MKDKLINASALERELREKMRRNDLKESDRLEMAAVLAAIQEAPEVETDEDH